MISELKDDEILEFLMTSDFEQDYKPEEFRYLLLKWRYFYRLLHGKYEMSKTDLNHEIQTINEKLKSKDDLLVTSQIENSKLQNTIDSMKNRKLTFKERLTGKIIMKEDENQ